MSEATKNYNSPGLQHGVEEGMLSSAMHSGSVKLEMKFINITLALSLEALKSNDMGDQCHLPSILEPKCT